MVCIWAHFEPVLRGFKSNMPKEGAFYMATVGQEREKRGPRLPTGPKASEIADLYKDEGDIGEVVEAPKVQEKVATPTTSVVATVATVAEEKNEFEEIKPRPKVPQPPAKTIQSADAPAFYQWLRGLTPEHFAQLGFYMYRTHPIIDRKPPKTKYIDCFSQVIDEQWVLETHGSGHYMIIVNDSGLDKKTKTITTAHLRIQNPIYPPKVNMWDLDVNHPDNKMYVERCIIDGKLKGDKTPMSEPNAATGGVGGGNEALVMLLDKMISRMDRQQFANAKDPKDEAISAAFQIISKGTETSTRMMLDQMKENDPTKLITLVTAIAELTKQPQQPQQNGMGDMLKFMELMDKRSDANLQLVLKVLETKKEEKSDDGDGLDKFLDRITKLQEIGGLFGGGGKKGTLETVLEYGMPVLGSIASAADSFFKMRAGLPVTAMPANGVPQNPSSQAPQQQRSVAAPPNVQTSQTQQPQAQPAPTQEQAMLMEIQIRNGLKQLTPMLVLALQRKNDNGTDFDGSQFAEGIDNTYGGAAYDMLAGLGKDKMLAFMREDQESWAQLSPFEARLGTFIDEFLDYGKPEPAEASGGADKPVNTPSREEQEAVFDISGGKKPTPVNKKGKG